MSADSQGTTATNSRLGAAGAHSHRLEHARKELQALVVNGGAHRLRAQPAGTQCPKRSAATLQNTRGAQHKTAANLSSYCLDQLLVLVEHGGDLASHYLNLLLLFSAAVEARAINTLFVLQGEVFHCSAMQDEGAEGQASDSVCNHKKSDAGLVHRTKAEH